MNLYTIIYNIIIYIINSCSLYYDHLYGHFNVSLIIYFIKEQIKYKITLHICCLFLAQSVYLKSELKSLWLTHCEQLCALQQ